MIKTSSVGNRWKIKRWTNYFEMEPLVQPSEILARELRSKLEWRISPPELRISSFHRLYLHIKI
jgi:hypothetical protein